MLTVYSAKWCPHCMRTVDYLKRRNIPFTYIEIEEQPDEVIRKIIDVNGGEDWVVPTLEYKGCWRPGKVFNEPELAADLAKWGLPGAGSPDQG